MPDEIRTMEADNFTFWAEFARRPGGATGREGGATWVETVENESQRHEWHDVLRDGFGLGDADAPHVAGVYGIAVRRAFHRQGLGALRTICAFRSWQIA